MSTLRTNAVESITGTATDFPNSLSIQGTLVPSGSAATEPTSRFPYVVGSVAELASVPEGLRVDGAAFSIASYHGGWNVSSDSPVGAGVFVYRSNIGKLEHDGIDIFSPTVSWNGSEDGHAAFLAGTGETDPLGTGVFVRLDQQPFIENAGGGSAKSETLNNSAGQVVYSKYRGITFMAGRYTFSQGLSIDNDGPVVIQGAGLEKTKLVFSGDVEAFSALNNGGAEGSVTVKDFSVVAVADSTVSKAFVFEFAAKVPGLTMENVAIEGDGLSGEWSRGVVVDKGSEHSFSNIQVRGKNQTKLIGFLLTSDTSAVSFTFHQVSVYTASRGINLTGASVGSFEGLKITDCDLVGVNRGIKTVNCSPQISVMQTHINTDFRALDIETCTQLDVDAGCLFYNSGVAAETIYLNDVSQYNINATISAIGPGDPVHVKVEGASGDGFIRGIMTMSGASVKPCIQLGANVTGTTVDGVKRRGGGFVLEDLNGTNILMEHMPRDPDSIQTVISALSGVLPVDKAKSIRYIRVSGASGDISSITGKYDGQIISLICSGGVTINHGPGILLSGGVNFTFSSDQIITLYKDSSAWRELSRS